MKLCECKCRIYVGVHKLGGGAPGALGNYIVYGCTLCLLVLGVELVSFHRSGTYIHTYIHTHTYLHGAESFLRS